MNNPFHILIVDDDTRLRGLLQSYLEGEGFIVDAAKNTTEARAFLKYLCFDAVVLDVMMPGETGLQWMTDLKPNHPDLPVLMLTALGEAEDRIAGLRSGVQDYLVKPFAPEELVLRLQNLIARSRPLSGRDIRIAGHLWQAKRQEFNDVKLSETEKKLMRVLIDANATPVSRQDLRDKAGLGDMNERSIDVHITRLRRKIEADPDFPRALQTVRGKGYILRID